MKHVDTFVASLAEKPAVRLPSGATVISYEPCRNAAAHIDACKIILQPDLVK
jgi:hypothetical protein